MSSPLDRRLDRHRNAHPGSLMHFPLCRVDIKPLCEEFPGLPESSVMNKFECVGLPGSLVRNIISHIESMSAERISAAALSRITVDQLSKQNTFAFETSSSPSLATLPSLSSSQQPHTASRQLPLQQKVCIRPHFDDQDDWVYSRCILADFTALSADDAEYWSQNNNLCCWARVSLRRCRDKAGRIGNDAADGNGGDQWELEFIVQRVGLRHPTSGWCECF